MQDKSAPGRQNGVRISPISGLAIRFATRRPTYAQTMGLELIEGPPNSGRAGAVIARFRDALARRPVLVVPTADDVAAFERDVCAAAPTTLGGSITTFAGLARDIAATLAVDLGPPLSPTQRQALVRAAIAPRRAAPAQPLRRAPRVHARRRPADRRTPGGDGLASRLRRDDRASSTIPPTSASSLRIYSAYVELRDASGRSDHGLVTASAIAALDAAPEAWGGRPVLVYGFDDLTRDQTRADRSAGAGDRRDRRGHLRGHAGARPRAPSLLARLGDELGAERPEPLPFDPSYTTSATLRHLDRNLFEPGATPIEPDDGLTLLDSAGARGEAEAIGIEIADLLASGYEADEIAIVLRHPDSAGPVLASVLRSLGISVALEASVPLARTCVGTSLVALCRAALDPADTGALLTHMRYDPSLDAGAVDWVEQRIRRGRATTIDAAIESWDRPPRHLDRLRSAADAPARLRALARSARELAEGAHRERAPLASRAGAGGRHAVLGARAARRGRGRGASRRARRRRRASRHRAARPRRRDRGAELGERPELARPGVGTRADHEPLPRPRGPGAGAVRRRASGGLVPELRSARPAAVGGAPAPARQPRPAPREPGRRGALPLSRVRVAPDRAPVSELAELRRGRRRARALAVRGRGARPGRPRRRGGRTAPARARARAFRPGPGRGHHVAPARPRARSRRMERRPRVGRSTGSASPSPRGRRRSTSSPGSRTQTRSPGR